MTYQSPKSSSEKENMCRVQAFFRYYNSNLSITLVWVFILRFMLKQRHAGVFNLPHHHNSQFSQPKRLSFKKHSQNSTAVCPSKGSMFGNCSASSSECTLWKKYFITLPKQHASSSRTGTSDLYQQKLLSSLPEFFQEKKHKSKLTS